LNVAGATLSHVIQANNIVQGKAQANGRVVIIGGSILGIEVAAMLAEQGKEVTLVSHGGLGGRKGPDEKIIFRALMRRLFDFRIPIYLNTEVLEITKTCVILSLDSEIFSIPADTVILAIGVKSVDQLAKELQGLVPEIYMVGDCVVPGNAAQATFGAARVAAEI